MGLGRAQRQQAHPGLALAFVGRLGCFCSTPYFCNVVPAPVLCLGRPLLLSPASSPGTLQPPTSSSKVAPALHTGGPPGSCSWSYMWWHVFIGVSLLYKAVLVSAIPWGASAVCIHVSPLSDLLPSTLFATPWVITGLRTELPVLYDHFPTNYLLVAVYV